MDKSKFGSALIFSAVFIAWFLFIGPALDKKFSPPVDVSTDVETVDANSETTSSGNVTSLDVKPSVEKLPEATTSKVVVPEEAPKLIEALPEKKITTTLFDAVIDPQQGIKAITLHDVADAATANVIIGDAQVPSIFLDGSAKEWKYGPAVVAHTETELSITRQVLGKDLTVVQKFTLAENYQFKTAYTFINTGKEKQSFDKLGTNVGQMGPIGSGDVGMMAGMDQAIDVYDKESEKVTSEFLSDIIEEVDEAEESQSLARGQGKFFADKAEQGYQWIAVKNRYFAWIVDIDQGFEKAYMQYKAYKDVDPETGKEYEAHLVSAVGVFKPFTVDAGGQHTIELECYAGPQKLDILSEMPHGKKGIMQLNLFMFFKVGWVGLISELMLRGLLLFYGWVGNYGIAIILLTVVIKILFWRITNKSTESMKKMSSLSPQMKELNEKYKDNPQVKQQKVMELYREVGVNPLAGCLPLLLQMPVFISLFNALRGAIELRHSEFLWVTDLSLPDTVFSIFGLPIRPLAIAWAVTMLIQQRIVPSSADETQKKVMMFMPVFMLFVCYGMPSGLTLYWTFSTLMSILQYYMSNKKAKKQEQTAAAAATG
jgi:YidC/Oxa1 family membrane protein insertase